ncbi:uncharacterized protein CELE_Y82E9BL.3 [Caenorhabditis elegans]|uniref:Uncharacterized protein n=1 Tax=Caenorhabditis elegans TaxID=6239 RepID=Q9GR30_CAEEL|nr:Uncharacterized protein CELE_Y82E9BL.3 [Caenorhabditis elegans]CCD73889.1 Uncharacterized protein CELE_Y82E9BL.3 [Caenorhabditis elegans]|eukprot:NP_497391.1 Uncharacterized protein CELE_Y82E9BL.3 [Caenorhabditis elegans]
MGAIGRSLYVLYSFFLVYFIAVAYAFNIILMFRNNELAGYISNITQLSMIVPFLWVVINKECLKVQQSIENFYWHRIFIAGAVVCLNILLPIAMILMFFGGWINMLASILIHSLLILQLICFANVLLESESPIKYTFPKTTKLTNLQKVSIFIFFTIMEVYYIYLCTWTNSSSNNYNIIHFLPGTIYLCPIINIMSIPAVVVACYAHNSDKVHLSRLRPDGGLEHIEIRTWDPATGIWGVDEKPEEHEILEI